MLKVGLSIAAVSILFYGCGGNNNCCDGETIAEVKGEQKKSDPQIVKYLPTAMISYTTSECTKGDTISFDARGSGDEDGHIVKYEWLMDEVVVASDPKPTFVCDKPGVKELCLRVIDDDNQTSKPICRNYEVKERVKIAPFAVISDISKSCVEGEKIFPKAEHSGDRDGEIISYNWSFFESNSTLKNPAFVCPKAGEYEICLEVIDNDKLNDKNCTRIIAFETPNKAPVAKIELSSYKCLVGESVELNATSSSDIDGFIKDYIWTPKTLSADKPSFLCQTLGSNEVCLEVVDDKDLKSQKVCVDINVSKPANIPPVAKITGVANECVVGDKIIADASTSTDEDGRVVGYLWSEDQNASASIEPKPIFSCDKEGIKKICLTVTDNEGADSLNKECKNITVKPRPIESIPPVAQMDLGESTGDGVWFDCSKSYDPDTIDGDNNAQNDGKIIKHHWSVIKTFKNGDVLGPHESDKCPKWIGTPANLDFMEVSLTVTDDDNEVTTITNIYDWDGEKLILRQ